MEEFEMLYDHGHESVHKMIEHCAQISKTFHEKMDLDDHHEDEVNIGAEEDSSDGNDSLEDSDIDTVAL